MIKGYELIRTEYLDHDDRFALSIINTYLEEVTCADPESINKILICDLIKLYKDDLNDMFKEQIILKLNNYIKDYYE